MQVNIILLISANHYYKLYHLIWEVKLWNLKESIISLEIGVQLQKK